VARRFGRVGFWLAWVLDGATWALGRYDWPTVAQKQQARRGSAGRASGGRAMLLVEPIASFTSPRA